MSDLTRTHDVGNHGAGDHRAGNGTATDDHAEVDKAALDSIELRLPWLPPAVIVPVPGRGEFFVRHHQHADPSAPTLLLLHGWTATADVQFFTVYEALAEHYSIVAPDHRGHGRGPRSQRPFLLEDAADDAAAVLDQLGIDRVITVGYSMGGPISLLLARRHPERVAGVVVEATALEWNASRLERLRWRSLPALGAIVRSRLFPRFLRRSLQRLVPADHELEPVLPWLLAEMQRGNPHAIIEAGRALRRFDATPWAGSLGVPAGMLITTGDRLVKPRKQRQLARALDADVCELRGDHLCNISQPHEFRVATVAVVGSVVAKVAAKGAAQVEAAASPVG